MGHLWQWPQDVDHFPTLWLFKLSHRLHGDTPREILVPALKGQLGTLDSALGATNVGFKHLGMPVIFCVQTEDLLAHSKFSPLWACRYGLMRGIRFPKALWVRLDNIAGLKKVESTVLLAKIIKLDLWDANWRVRGQFPSMMESWMTPCMNLGH